MKIDINIYHHIISTIIVQVLEKKSDKDSCGLATVHKGNRGTANHQKGVYFRLKLGHIGRVLFLLKA